MISIKIGHKDSDQRNIIKALQKLKQVVSREGTLNEVKKRRYFVKPSMAKRLKKEERKQINYKSIYAITEVNQMKLLVVN